MGQSRSGVGTVVQEFQTTIGSLWNIFEWNARLCEFILALGMAGELANLTSRDFGSETEVFFTDHAEKLGEDSPNSKLMRTFLHGISVFPRDRDRTGVKVENRRATTSVEVGDWSNRSCGLLRHLG